MSKPDLSGIDVLVLVGGQGKRLRKISSDVPKPLVLINKQPFLSIILNYLETFGFKRVVLCTGHKSEYIRRYINKENFSTLQLLISHEKKPLGTGGAIRNAKELINSHYFIAINGDTFLELNYFDFTQFFFDKKAVALLALTKTSNSKAYGSIKIDSNNRVTHYKEKAESADSENFISAGVYMFERIVLDYISSKGPMSLEYETFPLLVNTFKNKVYGFLCSGDFIDIGTPENFYKSQSILKKYQ